MEDTRLTEVTHVRMTPEQKALFEALGGGRFLRQLLDMILRVFP